MVETTELGGFARAMGQLRQTAQMGHSDVAGLLGQSQGNLLGKGMENSHFSPELLDIPAGVTFKTKCWRIQK